MFCFVTEKFHAQKSSCKAAKQAQTKERFLRYPPFVCSCLVLICTKKYERQKAHCGKIYYNVFQHIFVLLLVLSVGIERADNRVAQRRGGRH